MPPEPLYDLRGKNVWVAGETGMVGRAVLRALAQEDCKTLSAPHSVLDLTQQRDTYHWLVKNKPDVVVMAAGKVGGIGANAADPASFLHDNLAMAQNVIHGSYLAGVEKLLYLGSSCIYPKMAQQPMKEEALLTGVLEPTNEAYALAKIAGLKLCQYYRTEHGRDFISAMPTNLYGPHDHFDADTSHVIPAMILKIHQAKINGDDSVVLWGSGTPLREFLQVDDLADALLHLFKHYSEDTHINIGSGNEISIADLAALIAEVIDYEGTLEFDSSKPDGTPRKLLDSSRIQGLGWRAQTPLKKGIADTYQWFSDNV